MHNQDLLSNLKFYIVNLSKSDNFTALLYHTSAISPTKKHYSAGQKSTIFHVKNAPSGGVSRGGLKLRIISGSNAALGVSWIVQWYPDLWQCFHVTWIQCRQQSTRLADCGANAHIVILQCCFHLCLIFRRQFCNDVPNTQIQSDNSIAGQCTFRPRFCDRLPPRRPGFGAWTSYVSVSSVSR